MIRRSALGLSLLLASAGGAWAATTTPEEAQRLTAVLERFVGHGTAGQPGPVTVTPNRDGYAATVNLGRMLAFAAAQGVGVTAGDLTAQLTPQADGTWRVAVDGLPPIGVTQGDHASSIAFDRYAFEGVFDPRLRTFSSSQSTSHGVTTHVRGDDGAVDTTLTHTGQGHAAATDAGRGTVDANGSDKLTDVAYGIATGEKGTDGDASAAPPPFRLRASSVETATTWQNQPVAAMLDLWEFLVAHPSRPELVAAQPELKTRLKALLPLGTAFNTALAAKVVAIDTPLGGFGVEQVASAATVPNGPGPVTSHLAIGGLVIPEGLAPPWAVPLVPTAIDLVERQDPLGVSQALGLAIDDIDLAADKPLDPDQVTAITTALSRDGAPIAFGPSTIATPTLAIKLAGEIRLTKPLPTGHADVAATGLDKAIAAVRTASPDDPTAQQVIATLMAAKALGKAEGPDSYSWAIAFPPDGDLTVNGASLGSMGGAPAEPPPAHKKKRVAP